VRDVVLGLSLTPASAGGGRIVSGSARILADTQAFRPARWPDLAGGGRKTPVGVYAQPCVE
jgi:hypothetical protein